MISKAKTFLNRIKIFFGSSYKKFYILMFVLILNGVLEGLSLATIPILLSALFDSGKSEPILNYNILNYDLTLVNSVVLFGIVVIIVFLIKNIFLLFVIFYENYIYYDLKKKISSKVFYNLVSQDFVYQSKRNNSKTLRTISTDLYQSIEYYRLIILIIREALILLAIASLLIFVSSIYGISTFLILGIISYGFFRFVKNIIVNNAKIILDLRAKIINKIQNTLRGIKEIKIFFLEETIYKKFLNDIVNAEKKVLINDIIVRLPKIFFEILGIFLLVISLVILNFKMNLEELIPVLTLLAAAVVRLIPSYTSLTGSLSKIKNVIPSYLNILNEIKLVKKIKFENHEKIDFKTNFSKLSLINVEFSYDKEHKILENVNLDIKKGKTYFINGKSGKGKSTLCYLILGLLNPDQGKILVDGLSNTEIVVKKLFSYVPQESLIIRDTVKNNIIFDQKIDDKDYLKKICTFTGIDDFTNINDISLVGDSGNLISGGQKQRIAIARSLIRKPKILILDESFNALHEDAELKLIENIKKLCPDVTLLIISHRNSILKYSDEVINVMDNGSISLSKLT